MNFGARTTTGLRVKRLMSAALFLCVLSVPTFAEGGGDGGGGGKAAGVLFGLAAMTSAASQMAIPAIQAGADVDITKTNAAASISQSLISADLQRYQTDATERISTGNNITAMKINNENQNAQTQRLSMMLQEQAAARNQAFALKAEEQKESIRLRREDVRLAEINREEQYKLAVMKLQSEKIAAGLVSGFTSVSNSRPTVTRPSVGTQVAAAISNQVNSQTSRLLNGVSHRGVSVGERLSGFGRAAMGSTRTARQRVSDLSAFQASIAPLRRVRSLGEGETLHRSIREPASLEGDVPSHR